jgi:hypothetical protein
MAAKANAKAKPSRPLLLGAFPLVRHSTGVAVLVLARPEVTAILRGWPSATRSLLSRQLWLAQLP